VVDDVDRLPSSGASSGSKSTPNVLFVNHNEGDSSSKMPCIVSVESQSPALAESKATPKATFIATPKATFRATPKPTLSGALKGQPLTSSGVKVIRQIQTVDPSSTDASGRQRKKVVLVVSKPPNVEIPSVLSAVLQSKSLPSTPRRVATVTTGELVSVDDGKTKRLSESSSAPMEEDKGNVKSEDASGQEEKDNILTLQDPKTSGTVQIRLTKQPEEVAIIDPEDSRDYMDEDSVDYPDDDELYDEGSPAEEAETEGGEVPEGDTARRETMRRQTVRRAYLAREKARRRAERAKVKRAAVKKVREDEKVKQALAAMEEMLKQRDSEDLTVRNKPLPPEFRKIKRMLARKGLLPEKAMKKKRIDMPYKDKVAEHIAKLSPTEFQCKLCLEKFRWNYKCEQHILNHTGERPFKCHICGKSYKENCVLDQHMRMHKDKYLFVCEECGAGFKRRYLLSYHTRRFHGEEVRLLCEDCGKVFHSRETLSAHVRYHHKKRMVVCDVCGQVVRHSEMARHRRKHGPLTSCPLCNRQFRRPDARERHIQEHDNPTLPAHCIACGKYFRGRRSLMEHLDRVHRMETDAGLIPKTEPEGDSMDVPEDDEEDEEEEEDSRTSHAEEVQLQVHDFLDAVDVGATQQISIGEEEETKTASLVLDEISATVFVQQQ